MSYLVLARKWRPTTFDEVIGQEGVVRTLKNAIQSNRVAHAYLFCGARGVGKTTVARILAKALNCAHGPTPTPDNSCESCNEIAKGSSPDVLEIDGASNTGVDDVRSLRENSVYLPAKSRFKIYIIDEVHMLSTSAFNALLKTLEEPPAHVKFIFATTEPHKIPVTVLSRCQRFDFKRVSAANILAHLKRLLSEEGAQIEEEGLRWIAREAAGSLRDALSLLDQVLAYGGQTITTPQVAEALGLTRGGVFDEMTKAVLDNRPDDLMRLVERLFDEGHDLKRFVEGLLWHVHHLILFSTLRDPGELLDLLPEEKDRLRELSRRAEPLRWHQMFDVLSRALEELGRNPYPRLVLETALLRICAIDSLLPVDDLLSRVEDLARRVGASGESDGGGVSGQPAQRRTENPPNPAKTIEPSKAAEPSADLAGSPIPKEWEDLVLFVSKKRPSLGSVLGHAAVKELSKTRVRIALESGSFFADQMKSGRNRQDLEKFCAEFFGAKTDLVVEEQTTGSDATLVRSREIQEQKTNEEVRQKALAHPAVQEAIRVFGAEVDHVKTQGRRSP
jgi:DNA polymerase III subunit gamma/tau